MDRVKSTRINIIQVPTALHERGSLVEQLELPQEHAATVHLRRAVEHAAGNNRPDHVAVLEVVATTNLRAGLGRVSLALGT